MVKNLVNFSVSRISYIDERNKLKERIDKPEEKNEEEEGYIIIARLHENMKNHQINKPKKFEQMIQKLRNEQFKIEI